MASLPLQCKKESLRLLKTKDFLFYEDKLNNLYNKKYNYSEVKYVNCRNKVKIICPIHGIFKMSIQHHLRSGCNKCSLKISTGEQKVMSIIEELNIEYKFNKSFKNFKNYTGRLFRYDFWLPKYNKIIEYDGEQHYLYPLKYIKMDIIPYKFLERHKNDKLKDAYAMANGFQIIRIPYIICNYNEMKDIILHFINGNYSKVTYDEILEIQRKRLLI